MCLEIVGVIRRRQSTREAQYHRLILSGALGIAAGIDTEAAAVLYLGAIQGLVVQGMVSGEIASLEQTAPRIFKLYSASFQEMTNDPEK